LTNSNHRRDFFNFVAYRFSFRPANHSIGVKMKLATILVTSAFLSITATSLNSNATEVSDRAGGYKCVLKPGTLKFTGGANSEAVRSFTDFASINIYFAKKLMSGLLTPIAEGSLEFQPVDTLVTIAKTPQSDYLPSDTMYPTKQQTLLFDETSKQIKMESDLPPAGAITNVYAHTFESSKSSGATRLLVTIVEEQITDHATTKEASLRFEYEAPAALPQPMRSALTGEATAELTCEDQL
jgi:hypothetical protein